MTNELQVRIIVGSWCFWLIYCIVQMIMAWCRRGFVYGIKSLVGNIQLSIGVSFALYTIIAGGWLLRPFQEWWNTTFEPLATDTLGLFIYGTVPLAVVIMIVLITFIWLFLGSNSLWELTEEEKQYEYERGRRFLEKFKCPPRIAR